MEGSGSVQIITDPKPDQSGPKIYGSGFFYSICQTLEEIQGKVQYFINFVIYYRTYSTTYRVPYCFHWAQMSR
jgi:hypothetical protein